MLNDMGGKIGMDGRKVNMRAARDIFWSENIRVTELQTFSKCLWQTDLLAERDHPREIRPRNPRRPGNFEWFALIGP